MVSRARERRREESIGTEMHKHERSGGGDSLLVHIVHSHIHSPSALNLANSSAMASFFANS
jgi:hypothetical protein